jgi:hypothetical protein
VIARPGYIDVIERVAYAKNFFVMLKRASEYAADFLNRRREQRLNPPEESPEISSAEIAGCPPCPPVHIGYGPTDIFWFSLSGVLLGSALGVLVSYLVRPEE